ncbi:hypothetical protein Bbelb_176050 [Branchiostoma belcheri]|nr:hypothetical protein Bbelb_176050 [Branchiostoma belcheri]
MPNAVAEGQEIHGHSSFRHEPGLQVPINAWGGEQWSTGKIVVTDDDLSNVSSTVAQRSQSPLKGGVECVGPGGGGVIERPVLSRAPADDPDKHGRHEMTGVTLRPYVIPATRPCRAPHKCSFVNLPLSDPCPAVLSTAMDAFAQR